MTLYLETIIKKASRKLSSLREELTMKYIIKYGWVDEGGKVRIKGLPWINVSPKIKKLLITRHIKDLKGVEVGERVNFNGFPWILLEPGSKLLIGPECTFVSDFYVNNAGINHPCILSATSPNSIIKIGKGSGMSGATIVAAESVEIGEYVNIGVNSCIYDTDFHPLDPVIRRRHPTENACSSPIIIEDDVWLGANVIVLKGVTIGARSIVGAGSVVTHDVPPDTVVAGNPAKVIKSLK